MLIAKFVIANVFIAIEIGPCLFIKNYESSIFKWFKYLIK